MADRWENNGKKREYSLSNDIVLFSLRKEEKPKAEKKGKDTPNLMQSSRE